MRPFPSTPRALAAAGIVLAACGGPTMDAVVAEDLAGRAELLAARLEADDPCGAIATAGELVAAAAGGRDAGTVPPEVASEVIGTARETVRDLRCEPDPGPEPAPPADDDDDDDDDRDDDRDDGPGKGKGKGKGDRGGDD